MRRKCTDSKLRTKPWRMLMFREMRKRKDQEIPELLDKKKKDPRDAGFHRNLGQRWSEV